MTGSFTMYTTSWCGHCFRLKSQLERSGISDFDMVDIEEVPGAAETVAAVNDGMHIVPTLVFADGTALTNPSVATISAKLDELDELDPDDLEADDDLDPVS